MNPVHYKLSDKLACLFVHGVGMNASNWDAQTAYLGQYLPCYCIDLPGHGNSPALTMSGSAGVADYVPQVAEFISTVDQPSDTQWLLIGHSLGALIVLQLTQSAIGKQLGGVVAISTVYNRSIAARQAVQQRADELSDDSHEADHSTTLQRWFGARDKTPYTSQYDSCQQALAEVDRSAYAQAYRAFAYTNGAAASLVAAIRCPVLYLTGADDVNSSAAMSVTLSKLTPQGEYRIVPDARHMLHMTHASVVNPVLYQFIYQRRLVE